MRASNFRSRNLLAAAVHARDVVQLALLNLHRADSGRRFLSTKISIRFRRCALS